MNLPSAGKKVEEHHRPTRAFPSPPDNPSQDFDISQLEQHALPTFFFDYCVISRDRSLSRGYLDGLETLLHHAGPSSDVGRACKIVALASLGNKLGRPKLVEKAKQLYAGLLSSFRMTISDPATSNTVESLMTSALLGVYEVGSDSLDASIRISLLMFLQIITADESHFGSHGAHVRGVSAMLSSEKSPFDLRHGARLFKLANSLLLKGPLQVRLDYCTWKYGLLK